METSDGKIIIKVPANKMLISTPDTTELIDAEQFDFNKIVTASTHWSKEVDSRLVRKFMPYYFSRQQALINDLDSSCFVNGCKSKIIDSFQVDKIHKVKSTAVVTDTSIIKELQIK